jgi:hypothetical protein
MLEETTPRKSAQWRPHTTFAAEQGIGASAAWEHRWPELTRRRADEKGGLKQEVIKHIESKGHGAV